MPIFNQQRPFYMSRMKKYLRERKSEREWKKKREREREIGRESGKKMVYRKFQNSLNIRTEQTIYIYIYIYIIWKKGGCNHVFDNYYFI